MSASLNPEAAEFFPQDKQKEGNDQIKNCIIASKNFPSNNSFINYKTYTDFNVVTRQLSDYILKGINNILESDNKGIKLSGTDLELNQEKLIEANDNNLDRVNINIDVCSGVAAPLDYLTNETVKKNCFTNISSWNSSPIISKVKMGSAMLIGAKNIPRPQLSFKDPVDNSENLWIPKISEKPNSIKPLALNVYYNDNGVAIGYEHPYQMELDQYRPPQELVQADIDAPVLPPSLEDTPYTYVETVDQLDALVAHLCQVTEIAVDVEHHSYRTYQGITCLVQITTPTGGDFVVDALALRDHLYKLNLAFTDPKKIKIFHGATLDILWLQRDLGVYVVGLFDTHVAAKTLQHSGLSLKYLLHSYCQVEADKTYQLADWRIRPLPEELIHYARMDTHYLLYVWKRMKEHLLNMAGEQNLLQSVFEQSRQICGKTYQKTTIHEDSHLALYWKSKKSFNMRQLTALKLLYKWRDTHARELDESTAYILPNHMLLALAETLPREVQGVSECCNPMPPFVKQNLFTLHRIILSCRELPIEPQLYQVPSSISAVLNDQWAQTYMCHDQTYYPDFRDDLATVYANQINYVELVNDVATETLFKEIFENKLIKRTTLNCNAKSFSPPFERYQKYRPLAQIEEMKEFKQKEAKIAAIGKGETLIKEHVLLAMKKPEGEFATRQSSKDSDNSTQAPPAKPEQQRKRKIDDDNECDEDKTKANPIVNKRIVPDNTKQAIAPNVKPYAYDDSKYKQFFTKSNTQRPHQKKKAFTKRKM